MKHIGIAVACGTIGLVMLFLATGASARQFTDEECGGLATTAGQVANARNTGVPYSAVVASLEAAIASESPTSYITNEEDATLTRKLVNKIYYGSTSVEQTMQIVYRACMPPKRPIISLKRSV